MSDAAPLKITDEIAALVAGALDGGNAIIVAVVSPDNTPSVSIRGSVAVFGDDQLSFWARNAEGGTVEAIRSNPAISLLYRGPGVPLLQFIGRARVAAPGAETDRAFSLSHEREQKSDPDRNGVAVIVDLDKVQGVLVKDGARAFVRMARA
jgi:hypothetical protein